MLLSCLHPWCIGSEACLWMTFWIGLRLEGKWDVSATNLLVELHKREAVWNSTNFLNQLVKVPPFWNNLFNICMLEAEAEHQLSRLCISVRSSLLSQVWGFSCTWPLPFVSSVWSRCSILGKSCQFCRGEFEVYLFWKHSRNLKSDCSTGHVWLCLMHCLTTVEEAAERTGGRRRRVTEAYSINAYNSIYVRTHWVHT